MYLLILIISILLVVGIYYLKSSFPYLNESPTSDIRKLHSQDVTRIGGIIFFSSLITLFYVDDQYITNIIFFGTLILILGLIEDIYRNISKYFRLLILFALCGTFVDFNNFVINDFDSFYINALFYNNIYLNIFFSIIGLILLINAFNFIDGLNGLLLGVSIIILSTYAFYSLQVSSDLSYFIIGILFPLIILFIINFFGGIILTGDGGSYFLGFIIGCLSILISNYNILESFEIACIIFYPVMEITCSIIRRLLSLTNPLKPDGLHLHQILYRVVKYKFRNKLHFISDKNINSFSSLLILIIIGILIFIHDQISVNIVNDMIIFTVYCILYLLSYNLLISYCYKNNLFE